MAEKGSVKVFGLWASPFVRRVEIALKAKGIPYEYAEEDINNKSDLLLQYNPLYKKVPVLVHDGRPIAESLVIIEYIDDVWKNSPSLLPEDPYERAKVRFWADFINQQLFENLRDVILGHGEEGKKAIKQVEEKLRIMEENMEGIFPRSSLSGQSLGLLEILLGTLVNIIRGIEEVVGAQFVQDDKHPLLLSKMTALHEHPLMKETLPPQENLVQFLQVLREKFRPSSTA